MNFVVFASTATAANVQKHGPLVIVSSQLPLTPTDAYYSIQSKLFHLMILCTSHGEAVGENCIESVVTV